MSAWARVVDPRQYDEVARAVELGGLDADLREHLAREAFFRTAAYDAAIVGWMGRGPTLPELLVVPLRKRLDLRYGENPHQEGAAYSAVGADAWWADAAQIQGKQMSFNNYLDTEAAWRLVHVFDEPAAAVIKHANPAGVAWPLHPPMPLLRRGIVIRYPRLGELSLSTERSTARRRAESLRPASSR